MTHPAGVVARLEQVEHRITAACRRSGRERAEITLIGASKQQPVDRMRAAWEVGLRVFGENRVQEAEEKKPALPGEARWHLIGALQSNKVRRAVPLFPVIHSVDRLKIARRIDREAARLGIRREGLIEVNLGGEASKHGFTVAELAACEEELFQLEHLQIQGLMAIPPPSDQPEGARPWFRKLRALGDEVSGRRGDAFAGWLSMGMSGDFEVAIEEGATHVRVGTALFGPRPKTERAR